MRYTILFVLICLWTTIISGQEFHRTYKLQNDEQDVNLFGLQSKEGNYYSLDGIYKVTNGQPTDTIRNVIITMFDAKGEYRWARQIFYAQDSQFIEINNSSLLQDNEGNLIFGINIYGDDEPFYFNGSITSEGSVLWSNSSKGKMTAVSGNNITKSFGGQHLQVINGQTPAAVNQTLLNTYNNIGELINSKRLVVRRSGVNTVPFPDAIGTDLDSSTIILSTLENTSGYALMVLDSLQRHKFTTFTYDSLDALAEFLPFSVEPHVEGGYIVSGGLIRFSLVGFEIKSYVARHDTIGRVMWAKELDYDENLDYIVYDALTISDGSILVSGSFNTDTSGYVFLSKMNDDGKLIWSKKYDKVDPVALQRGNMQKTKDGGYAIFSTALVNDVLSAMSLVKTNADGEAMCESPLEDTIFFDLKLKSDSIGSIVTNSNYTTDTTSFRADGFASYAVPVLSLNDTTFCPNEPIDWVFKAEIPGATSYKWSTGATTDTLRVFDDEEYSVTVTVAIDVCYTVCDTIALKKHDLPQVTGSYICVGGDYLLSASPSTPAGFKSIRWSMDSTINTTTVRVPEQGSYTVTITDQCDETATATIVVDPPKPIISPTFNCRADGIHLFSNFDPALTLNIAWSTGAADNGKHEVVVPTQGNYNVTVTDICDETVVATVSADPPKPTLTGSFECIPNGIEAFFVMNPDVGRLAITWSTGSADNNKPRILVPAKGTYSVTVVDFCRDTLSTNININPTPPAFTPTIVGCNTMGQIVSVNFDANRIKTLKWSTGSQDDNKNPVTIATPGTYSVTLTDFCNETSTRNIEVPKLPDQVTINRDFSGFCTGQGGRLSAMLNGQATAYNWNTGSDTSFIIIQQPGTYRVTVTDLCGNMITANTVVQEADLPVQAESVTIIRNDSTFCVDDKVQLTAVVVGPNKGISWSNGSKEATIRVPVEDQTLTVTVLDDCGNLTAQTVVSGAPEDCIRFPNAFFPEGSGETITEDSKVFGGFIKCPEFEPADYQLRVFNRWGQEVFSSTSVLERWTGLLNGSSNNPAASDVYVWYATWSTDECSIERKGDVTLFK